MDIRRYIIYEIFSDNYNLIMVAFQSRSSQLCTMILEVISSIFHQDNSNYFIVEPQSTLSEFAEIIHNKPHEVQVRST